MLAFSVLGVNSDTDGHFKRHNGPHPPPIKPQLDPNGLLE